MSDVEKIATGKRRRFFWIFGSFVVVVLVAVLALGWLGLVPGVSAMLGANQPRDLGVQYTPSDLAGLERKSGIRFEDVADAPDHLARRLGKKKVFADPKSIDGSFTQEELSAALNSASIPWLPLKDVQVKLSDHVIEVSGLLKGEGIRSLLKLAAELDLTESNLAYVAGYTEALADNVPVYIKREAVWRTPSSISSCQQFSVGRFNSPRTCWARLRLAGFEAIKPPQPRTSSPSVRPVPALVQLLGKRPGPRFRCLPARCAIPRSHRAIRRFP